MLRDVVGDASVQDALTARERVDDAVNALVSRLDGAADSSEGGAAEVAGTLRGGYTEVVRSCDTMVRVLHRGWQDAEPSHHVPSSSRLAALDGASRALEGTYHALTCVGTLAAQLEAFNGSAPAPAGWYDLGALAEAAAEDVLALCVEKYGVRPPLEVSRAAPARCLVDGGLATYALLEVLKNACTAVVERVGALDVDDAPPIRVAVSASRRYAGVRVDDAGGGFDPDAQRDAFRYLCSGVDITAEEAARRLRGGAAAPTYTYSRDFGVAMHGHGVGLPRARLAARYMGGSLQLSALPGDGATATLTLQRAGTVPDMSEEHVRAAFGD